MVSASTTQTTRGPTKVLFGTLLIALALLAFVRILLILRDFTSPTELTFPNSVMVYKAREVQQGRPLYADWRQPPHVLTLYGPLLYAVPGLVGRWINANEVTLFYLGRVHSLIGTTGALAVVAWLIGRTARRRPAEMATGVLIVFTAPILWPVCTVFRPDPVEMLWTLLGLALFLRRESTPWRYASVAAFLMAFLYKQSGAVGPVAVTLYLLLNRRTREAVSYGAFSLIAFLIVVAALNLATGGLHWLNNVTALHANVTWSNLITVTLESALLRCLIPFVPAIGIVIWRWSRRQFDLLSVFFVVALCAAAAATVRDGSADNYFLTALAVGTVIVAQGWARWRQKMNVAAAHNFTLKEPGTTREWPAIASLAIALVFSAPRVWSDVRSIGPLRAELAARSEREAQRLTFVREAAARLDALGGPVFCQFDPVNLYTRNTVMLDTLTFGGLADQGVFDDAAIIQAIRDKQFSAIVLLFPAAQRPVPRYQSTDWFRAEWADALVEAGYQESVFGPLFVFTP